MLVDGQEERVQLIDFGLAKVPVERLAVAGDDARRSITQAGVVLGTVAYMAPEAALGMRSIDRRSDLYALGVILYEMLTGKHPFTAVEATALFAQHRAAIPPAFAERAPGVEVPRALEAVTRCLLEKDPDDRYPHARAVIVALDAAQKELAARAPDAARGAGLEGLSRRVKVGAVLALCALVGVVVLLLASR
jgi:serine/threonine-protein kinase